MSDLFYHGGLIIHGDGKSLSELNYHEVLSLFEKHGVLLFRNFAVDPKKINEMTDRYTESYSQDAPRRATRFNQSIVHDVDPGYLEMPLHSETSYSTAWPEIIWFLCLQPAKQGGATILCDGIQLWDSLPAKLREFFLFNPICYKVSVSIQQPRVGRKPSVWSLGVPGTGNGVLNWESGSLQYTQLRFAVHESRLSGKYAFANHLFIYLDRDPQVLSRTMQDGSEIPNEILTEAKRIAESLTYEIPWRSGDLIMIDNKRFLHGRRAYDPNDLRDIAIVQTKRANFAYGATTRRSIVPV